MSEESAKNAENTTVSATPDWPVLSLVEARVLGSLIEKQITTPDYYPLTLNALVAACNQKNNRDPVMQLEDSAVLAATDTLREKKLVWQMFLAGNRVPKYRHAFTDVYHVPEEAVPLFCELLARGPQTPGELRTRCARMREFPDVETLEALLQQLATHREGPFVVRLVREPGRRECRYAHLLGGPVDATATAPAEPMRVVATADAARLAKLEQTVADLQERLAKLETRVNTVM